MSYGFFNTSTTPTKTLTRPEKIRFIDRPDMAVAVFMTDQVLMGKAHAKAALVEVAVSPNLPQIAHAQTMASWLHELTSAIKKTVLNTDSNTPVLDSHLWFIHAISQQTELNINLAETMHQKSLSKKTDSARPADITVHKQAYEVVYTVPTQHGNLFEFLNHRISHPTSQALDARCVAHHQTQLTNAQNICQQQTKTIEAIKNNLLMQLPADEIHQQYVGIVGESTPSRHLFIPYENLTEAQAIRIAAHQYHAQSLTAEESPQQASMSHPHI